MIAFIHIGKTGGLTVQSILASQFGTSHCDVKPWKPLSNRHAMEPFGASDHRKLKWLYPSLACISGHHVMPFSDLDEVYNDLRYFAFLRDPVKRMASAYQQHCKLSTNIMSFESYCEIETHRNQQCIVMGGNADAQSAIEVIENKQVFVGLMERFDESLVLLKALHINDLQIGYTKRNIAPSQQVSNELLSSPESLKLLRDANIEDQKLYDYVTNKVFEQYLVQYGKALPEDVKNFQSRAGNINNRRIILSKLKRKIVYEPILKIYQVFC